MRNKLLKINYVHERDREKLIFLFLIKLNFLPPSWIISFNPPPNHSLTKVIILFNSFQVSLTI